MSGRIGLLSALLGVQLLIIAAVLLLGRGAGAGDAGPFLDFEPQAVDEIRISGPGDQAVVLSRGEDGWRLASGLPADAAKVDGILGRLDGLEAPFPVATSAAARERFEVGADNHQRHVVLSAGGDVVAELYLGTSPGYQQVHARRADGSDVYAVGLSNFELPAEADEWLDKALLQPRGEIETLTRRDAWTLRRAEQGWLIDADPADAADAGVEAAETAADLLRRFTDLRVMGTATAPARDGPSAGDVAPVAEFDVTDADGQYVLTLYGDDEGGPYTVVSSRRDGHFELAAHQAEQMLVERAALLPEDADAQSQGETESAAADADAEQEDAGASR